MVVVVNEVVARRYFPGSDPIGRRVQLGRRGEAWAEIVGVVGATRNQGLDVEPAPELFLSSLQVPGWDNQMFLLVRTEGDPRIMANAIRSTVHSIDPDQPIYRMQTIEETYDQGQLSRRISVIGFTLFAAFALVLAAVGLYGVVSYSTAQRIREIGVRVALGGARTAVAGLFVRQAMVPVGIGVVIGLGAAWGVGRAMASLLFEVGAGDGLTLLGAAGLLVAVGLLASYLPAARASRIDPVTTLRQD
jgi:putative ABC transport system permease protein